MSNEIKPLFELGRIVATRPVSLQMDKDESFRKFVFSCLIRHANGDFGVIPEEDVHANLDELIEGVLEEGGGRVLSRYQTDPEDIYIQTMNENGDVYTCVMYCKED